MNQPTRSLFRHGRGSDNIAHLSEVHRDDPRPIVLLLRVSTQKQARRGNLRDQGRSVFQKLAALGLEYEVVCMIIGVEVSSIDGDYDCEFTRPLLAKAIDVASEFGARLVADTRDRFIRHKKLDGTKERELPTNREYKSLLWFANGVPLATIEHPDAPARPNQVRRGQSAKGQRGGRPRKPRFKERRQDCIRRAAQLRDTGMSFRKIADELNRENAGHRPVSHGTIRNWLTRRV